ncbi:LysR substrate-binding domain-containing protein [Phyllobacterium sp. OV277]|uniref:LysR substrate-binding domain-containing protein n=1 Tax=Phyllobacterium sp. OV277 TaxID=1882772 RepID=UPI001FCCE2D9|nr:LysR substrate-binding domain-containing protein [Phyllobacterium sp. OV277]
MELLLVPELTARLRTEAPGIRLLGRPTTSDGVHRLLDDGEFDLAIGCFEANAQRHKAEILFEQDLSCVFNPALLTLKEPLGMDDYLALPHVLVTLTGRLQGCLDRALDEVDSKLNVVTAATEFLTVLSTARRSSRRYRHGWQDCMRRASDSK